MSPRNDALIINANLLLDYEPLAREAYASVGVDVRKIETEPYQSWLPAAVGGLRTAIELQTARDARFTDRLFDHTKKNARELSALDLVHLFVEAGAQVAVVSHESEDALAAIVARVGLPESVMKMSGISLKQRDLLVKHFVTSGLARWYAVYETGLTPKVERRTVDVVKGDGVVINVVSPSRSRAADDKLLAIVNERWSYM